MIDTLHICLFMSVLILIVGYNAACMRATANEEAAKYGRQVFKDIMETYDKNHVVHHVAMTAILRIDLKMIPGRSNDEA